MGSPVRLMLKERKKSREGGRCVDHKQPGQGPSLRGRSLVAKAEQRRAAKMCGESEGERERELRSGKEKRAKP